VDITDPTTPQPLNLLDVQGEPKSISVQGSRAFVTVTTDTLGGVLHIIDIPSQSVLRTIELAGQPDSIDTSATYAVVCIESEGSAFPEAPPGVIQVLSGDMVGDVSALTLSTVSLVEALGDGLVESSDPEPESVSIREDGSVAVVTLQENNGMVLLDLNTQTVVAAYAAGTIANLTQIDNDYDEVIQPSDFLENVARQPDGVVWLDENTFATANEGDLRTGLAGGARGFTIYSSVDGAVIYESGNSFEHDLIRHGHYPEERSQVLGNEPESVAFGTFGGTDMLFVGSERGSVVLVYDVTDRSAPVLAFVLPTLVAPEGILTIPEKNLVVVASEEDSRRDRIRAGLSIFQFDPSGTPDYPTIVSTDRMDGTPIPFSSLSGLVAFNDTLMLAVEDSFFKRSRILVLDTSAVPAVVVGEAQIRDDSFAVVNNLLSSLGYTGYINRDNTLNIDVEGIAFDDDGVVWLAVEGSGTVGDERRPVRSLNMLLKVNNRTFTEQAILLPDELNAVQNNNGFHGIAIDGANIVTVMERAWNEEELPRLSIYNTESESWKFYFYPVDEPEALNRGSVGVSEITSLGSGAFLVLERDNRAGPDARVKRIYRIELGDFSMTDGTTVEKTLVRDLMGDLASLNGNVFDQIDGMALTPSGNVYIVNNNKGLSGDSGEQRLMNLGAILDQVPEAPVAAPMQAPVDAPVESPPVAVPTTVTTDEPTEDESDVQTPVAEPPAGSSGVIVTPVFSAVALLACLI